MKNYVFRSIMATLSLLFCGLVLAAQQTLPNNKARKITGIEPQLQLFYAKINSQSPVNFL